MLIPFAIPFMKLHCSLAKHDSPCVFNLRLGLFGSHIMCLLMIVDECEQQCKPFNNAKWSEAIVLILNGSESFIFGRRLCEEMKKNDFIISRFLLCSLKLLFNCVSEVKRRKNKSKAVKNVYSGFLITSGIVRAFHHASQWGFLLLTLFFLEGKLSVFLFRTLLIEVLLLSVL